MSLRAKQVAIFTTATLALLASSLNVQAASESAKINITATVVDNTCTPEWDKAGVDVPMGKASLRDFGGQGAVALTKTFDLKLSDCGDGAQQVTVTANGTPDGADTKAFKNLTDVTAGGASGVAVEIFGDRNLSTQMLTDDSTEVTYPIANNQADMIFEAKLEQSGAGQVTVGDVKTVVNMTVSYE